MDDSERLTTEELAVILESLADLPEITPPEKRIVLDTLADLKRSRPRTIGHALGNVLAYLVHRAARPTKH